MTLVLALATAFACDAGDGEGGDTNVHSGDQETAMDCADAPSFDEFRASYTEALCAYIVACPDQSQSYDECITQFLDVYSEDRFDYDPCYFQACMDDLPASLAAANCPSPDEPDSCPLARGQAPPGA